MIMEEVLEISWDEIGQKFSKNNPDRNTAQVLSQILRGEERREMRETKE